MSAIGTRIREARERKGWTQHQLAEESGVSQPTVANYERGPSQDGGHNPGRSSMQRLAKALGVSARWIEYGEAEDAPESGRTAGALIEVAGAEYARLPVFDIRAAAGAGSINDNEDPIGHHLMSVDWLRSMTDSPLSQISVLQVAGDSGGEKMPHGSWIFIDHRRTRLTNPGIYVLSIEGDLVVKHAQQHPETRAITLVSANPLYPRQVIKKPDRISVVGRVFLVMSRA